MEITLYSKYRELYENIDIDFIKLKKNEDTELLRLEYIKSLHETYCKIYIEFHLLKNELTTYNLMGVRLIKDETDKEIISNYNNSIDNIINSIKYQLNYDFYANDLELCKHGTRPIFNDEYMKRSDLIKSELKKITDFLKEEKEKEKEKFDVKFEIESSKRNINNSTNTNTEKVESDFSDNEDKVKLIILEKLGILDFIKSKQSKPNTISHTAEIISSFTGIKSQTLYSYLLPILQPNRNDEDKNSPYNNTVNVFKANKQYQKFKLKDADK